MDNTKKVLLIAPGDSLWTYYYATHIFSPGPNIYFFVSHKTEISDNLKKRGYTVIEGPNDYLWLRKLHRIGSNLLDRLYVSDIKEVLRKNGPFEVAHLQWLDRKNMLAIKEVRKYTRRLICTFWGSDLLRASNKELVRYKACLKKADYITVSTNVMRQRLSDSYSGELNDKIKMERFGISSLDYIDDVDTESCKKKYNLPPEKIVVSIGYNGKESQQHVKTIDAISMVDDKTKEKLFILLPMTYGLNDTYREELVERLQASGLDYKVIDWKMDDEEIGMLRKATDFFIHSQITDAMSASVQEYLYAKKLLFNPKWIKYPEIEKAGAFFIEFEDFEDLTNKVTEAVADCKVYEDKLAKNKDIIYNLSSWQSVMVNWRNLYEM